MNQSELSTLIESVKSHEPLEHFPSMTKEEAVDLGMVAVQVIREKELSLAVDIILADDLIFRAKQGRTGLRNEPYLAGKAAVTRHFNKPSLLVRYEHELSGETPPEKDDDGVTLMLYGGTLPLRVDGELVGTMTLSGEQDYVDHEAAIAVLKKYRKQRGI